MIIKFQPREMLNPDTYGGLRIWTKPQSMCQYAIGVDVAEGIGKDASCAQVLDVKTGKQVACFWNDTVDVDNFGAEVYKLGMYYNKAWVCVEANNHGHAVIGHLGGSFSGLAYPHLYKRYEYDEFTRKQKRTIGFKTTPNTKPRIIENLKSALRDGEVQVFDEYTTREIGAYVRTEKGRMGAKGKGRDDRVMALALAEEQRRVLNCNKADEDKLPEFKYDQQTGFPIF